MISALSGSSSLPAAATQTQSPSGVDPTAQDPAAQDGTFRQTIGQMATVIHDIQFAEAHAAARIHMAIQNVVASVITAERSLQTRVIDPNNTASANQTSSETLA